MKIHFPNSAFLGNIDSFLKGFDPNESNYLEITGHQKWISVHPVVLAMVGALSFRTGHVECGQLEAKSVGYLERMGLFKTLNIPSKRSMVEHDPSGRFIPLTQIKNSEELTKFLTDMIPLLHLSAEEAESIRYVVSEMVRNVLEHSGSEHGAILAAQYYPKDKVIRLGVADTGLGIKTTITAAHPASDDLSALRLALTPGITGTTRREGGTDYNAGAGLFFVKSMAYVNRDFFMLYSGNAMYKLLKRLIYKEGKGGIRLHVDPFANRHSKRDDLPYWQGTVVGIDLSLSSTEEFSDLLAIIRQTYSKAVRERRKERYRKPRFI